MTLHTPAPTDWSSALALLARLHPPQSVWHVGSQPAGAPSYLWQQWGVPHALFINPLAQAQDNLPEGWVQCNAVLGAEAAASADFYRASLPAEAGLLPPEALRPLWPNIHTTDIEQRPVNTLAQLPQLLPGHPAPNWLMVDTLPALPVLQGGAELVAQAQVVTVRVLLANPVADHLTACTLPAVQHLMHQLGFVGVAVYPSHNPQLGQALFVRNWPQQLQHSHHTAHQQVQALQHRIQVLNQDQVQLLQNLQQEISIRQGLEAELATQNQNWAAQADLLSHQLAQGQDQLNHQAHTLAQLTQAREQEAQAKAEALQKLQQETTSRQELETQINAKAQAHAAQVHELTQARDAEAQAKAEALQKLQQETTARLGLERELTTHKEVNAFSLDQQAQKFARTQLQTDQTHTYTNDETTQIVEQRENRKSLNTDFENADLKINHNRKHSDLKDHTPKELNPHKPAERERRETESTTQIHIENEKTKEMSIKIQEKIADLEKKQFEIEKNLTKLTTEAEKIETLISKI